MWNAPERIPSIREMLSQIDLHVAGLKDQKARLATILHRHLVASSNGRHYQSINPIVLGPTGGGKSFLVHWMLEISGLPYIEINATQFSEVGYAGLDLSSMFLDFFDKYQGPGEKQSDLLPKFERWGVVVLDEFDKWRVIPNPKERQPQRALQAELLRILEGDTVHARKQDSQRGIPIHTYNLLFIALGAFEGLDDQMSRHWDVPNPYLKAEPWDLMQYGFLMELMGRFPEVLALPPLDTTAIAQILQDHIWPRYEQEAHDAGVDLVTDVAAMREIAGQAIAKRIGARALPNVINTLLWRSWAQARPGDQIVVDVPAVLGRSARLESKEVA